MARKRKNNESRPDDTVSCAACGETSGRDENTCQGCGLPTPFRGGGWGRLAPGERVSDLGGIRFGEILLDESPQFHARNAMRVTRIVPKRDLMYCIFVNPENTALPRCPGDREFCVHGFEMKVDSPWDRRIRRVAQGAAV